MNIDICRKCQNWRERIRLEDKMRLSILSGGCCLTGGAHFMMAFRDEKYEFIRNCIKRVKKSQKSNCDRHACNWNDMRFKKIVEFIKVEHEAFVQRINDSHAVKECPYFMEQEISGWNR